MRAARNWGSLRPLRRSLPEVFPATLPAAFFCRRKSSPSISILPTCSSLRSSSPQRGMLQ